MSVQSFSISTILRHEAKQFCLNTALHGYKFIVLPRRILLERVFWAITVGLSLGVALYLLYMTWMNSQQSPTSIITQSTHFPIWYYPFPAVTLCSFNLVSREKLFTFIKKNITALDGFTQDELIEQMKLVAQLITYNNYNVPQENLTRLQNILNVNNINADELLEEISEPCTTMLQRCKWKGDEKNCETLFEKVTTSDGYCCSFNYFALKNHIFKGSRPRIPIMKPRKVSACGYSTGLEMLIENRPDDYFATLVSSVGHKILIHNSYNLPDWNVQIMLTESKINHLIGVTPFFTESNYNVEQLDISKRRCTFPSEITLGNFKSNFHNCMAECRMNLTVQFCGCIPFFYNNKEGTYPTTRICNLNDITCLKQYKSIIDNSIPGFDSNWVKSVMNLNRELDSCYCLPDCDYIDYMAEASFGSLTRKYAINQVDLYGNISITNHSVIRVYFNDIVATKHKRILSFRWHTLLAYFGGLLGILVGFNFLSGVEFIYFFTIKLIDDVFKNMNSKRLKKYPVNVKPLANASAVDNKKFGGTPNQVQLRRRSNSNIYLY